MINTNLSEIEKRSQIEGKKDNNFPNIDFLNVNMFVEAGAGAGKTTLIVRRIVNQLINGDEPGSFVVITFTNAAAEELRERITAQVKDAGLKSALEHLDEMTISTIHSFCNVLLKEQSIKAGLPQSMRLMEPGETAEIQTKYFNEFMSKLTVADWDAIESDVSEDNQRWKIRKDIADLYSQMVDLPKDTNIIMPNNVSIYSNILQKVYDDREKITEDLIVAAFRLAKGLINPQPPAKAKVIQYNNIYDVRADSSLASLEFIKLIDAICNNMNDKDKQADEFIKLLFKRPKLFKAAKGAGYLSGNIDAANNAFIELIDARIGELIDATTISIKQDEPLFEQLKNSISNEKHYQCLVEYAKKAKQYYYDNKPADLVSNDNLLEITRDLICGKDTSALEFFSKKYKHFYVDEFQDTDRIQESFIYRLASDLNDPNHIKLRDGALFVVGDPKQSIYRFRGAQPEIYFDVKERMSDSSMANTHVYELEKNFRSNSEIIEWVNDKFTDSDTATPIVLGNHPYAKMSYDKTVFEDKNGNYIMPDGRRFDKNKLIHGMYKNINGDATYWDNNHKKLIYNNDKSVEADIKDVINLILNLKNQHYMITRYDRNNNFVPYPDYISFKDFLLIPQDMKQMEMYLSALKKYGIPVRFDGEAKLCSDKVLNTFTRLYWYILNPKEPFHRMAAKEAIRVSNIVDDINELEKYTDYLLDALYYGAKGLSAFGKAVYLENKISALFDKNRVYDVIEIYAAKTRLRQMIEKVLYGATGTGVQIAEEFDKYVAGKLEHELSLEPGADAVRFMNLHKTKGLEGEIVIFLDRRGHRKAGLKKYKDGVNFYPGITSWSSVSSNKSISTQNDEEETAEFHRLEYVAVTRAKQAVIFMDVIEHGGIFATSSNKFIKNIDPNAPAKETKGYNYHIDELDKSVSGIISSFDNEVNVPVPNGNYKIDSDGYDFSGKAIIEEKPLYEKVNPSKLEKKHSSIKGRCIRDNKKALSEKRDTNNPNKTAYEVYEELFSRPFGNILGNVLHRTMELLVDRFDASISNKEDIEKLASFCTRQAVKENEDSIPSTHSVEAYQSYVCKAAIAYYKWLTEKKIFDEVKGVYTELPFSYYTKESNALMKGTADLIMEYNDGRVLLIDYKSDNDFLVDENVMGAGLEEKYSPQLKVYKEIIIRMFKAKEEKITAGIISFSLKDENGKRLPDDEIRVRYTIL